MNTVEKNDTDPSILHKINDYFKMPIYFNNNKVELKKNIITDLELINTVDASCNPIYSFCFNNDLGRIASVCLTASSSYVLPSGLKYVTTLLRWI